MKKLCLYTEQFWLNYNRNFKNQPISPNFAKQKMQEVKQLVIIPTFNEIGNIARIIKAVFALSAKFDVLIIDDGSPDGTAKVVENLIESEYQSSLHLIKRAGKLGLGTAYIAGFKWALQRDYTYVFEMDADFSHDPKDLVRLLQSAQSGYDLVIGSRYVQGVNVVNWPMSRVLLSFFASKYVRIITGMKLNDATAGFVCFHRKVLETINLDRIKFVGYAFQIEMKFKTKMHGFKIKEIPIIFTDRTVGQSKMSKGIITEAVLGVISLKVRSWFTKFEPYKQSL